MGSVMEASRARVLACVLAPLCRALPLRREGSGYCGTRKAVPIHDCRCRKLCGQQHIDVGYYSTLRCRTSCNDQLADQDWL